jgi:acetyl-CoA C-acetyltransferase
MSRIGGKVESLLQGQTMVDTIRRGLHCCSHIIPHLEDGPINTDEPPLSFFIGKPNIMGHTAEFVAQYKNISREDMDKIALRGHNLAEKATNDGSFKEESLIY